MAGTNQFLAFATGTGANVLTPSAYAALTALVAQGFQSGVAPSQQVNTPIRQSTFVTAAIAQLIADYGLNANDDGVLATFKNNLSQAIALPRGAIFMWPSATPPAGCLILNGSAISRTTYAFLFTLFGTTFGTGDGSTTFNLPDYRDRVPVGVSSTILLGGSGGSKDAVVVSHNHSASSSSSSSFTGTAGNTGAMSANATHNHTYSNAVVGGPVLGGTSSYSITATGTTSTANIDHTHAFTPAGSVSTSTTTTNTAAGVSGVGANMMPYLANNFVIKY